MVVMSRIPANAKANGEHVSSTESKYSKTLSSRYARTVDQTPNVTTRQDSGIEPYYLYIISALFLTILLGTIYSLLNHTSRETLFRTRIPAHAIKFTGSHLAFELPNPVTISFFADKRNFFNQYFVKLAWGWTSLACLVHYVVSHLPSSTSSSSTAAKRLEIRPLLRYTLATLFWIGFARWAFGPSLSHRILTGTGGFCTPSALQSSAPDHFNPEPCLPGYGMGSAITGPWSAQGVQIARDQTPRPESLPEEIPLSYFWKGGHDVSGHTFILVHAILLLLTTLAPTLARLYPSLRSSLRTSSKRSAPPSNLLRITTFAMLALVGLWWWMLLMTSVYFHSPPEKFTGFISGLAGWLTYIALLP